VGLLVATQFVRDIPDDIAGNLATKVIFLPSSDDARSVARLIAGTNAGGEAERIRETALALRTHQALFVSDHYQPYVLVNTRPYFRR
jgi:hypothetical protein